MGERGRAKAEREWSWPRLVDRMDGAYAEAIEVRRAGAPHERRDPRRRILLVAYFYPPCRDTGILRPAAMAKWLRRLGHEVTVLTTSAYGEPADDAAEDVVRTRRRPALAGAAARARTRSGRCSTPPPTAAGRTR